MSAVAAMARTGEYATVGGSTRTSTVRPWFTSLISREWITAAAHCCTCFDATHSTFSLSVKPVPATWWPAGRQASYHDSPTFPSFSPLSSVTCTCCSNAPVAKRTNLCTSCRSQWKVTSPISRLFKASDRPVQLVRVIGSWTRDLECPPLLQASNSESALLLRRALVHLQKIKKIKNCCIRRWSAGDATVWCDAIRCDRASSTHNFAVRTLTHTLKRKPWGRRFPGC